MMNNTIKKILPRFVLPVATTLLGVLAAAYLAYEYDNYKNKESVNDKIEIACTDLKASYSETENILNKTCLSMLNDFGCLNKYTLIPEPKILISIYENDLTTMSSLTKKTNSLLIQIFQKTIKNIKNYNSSIVDINHHLKKFEQGYSSKQQTSVYIDRELIKAKRCLGLSNKNLYVLYKCFELELLYRKKTLTRSQLELRLDVLVNNELGLSLI